MKNSIIISTLALLLFACSAKTEKKQAVVETSDSSTVTTTNIKSERFFPENKEIVKFDTLLVDKQLQVTIIKKDLNSYVTNEYDDNGKKQIDNYRDAEITVIIKQKSQILLDTIFRKKQFSQYADNDFMDIAIFHNYWFNKVEKDKIEFFGVISKPETDYTLAFYHFFDLTSRKLNLVEQIDDEE
jgi:hypothetical protein